MFAPHSFQLNNKETMKLPTVKIPDGAGGFWIINKSDFDSQKHELFEDSLPEIELITEQTAAVLNRDQLREYAQFFGITGRSKDEIFEFLKKAGKFIQSDVE